jgi:hypothetical protein
LKRFIFWSILVFAVVMGCSPGNPTLSDSSISSENSSVFAGQRILVQVNAITDNPPFTYEWSATGGTFADNSGLLYANLWTAPETAGTYTISCRITDKEKKHSTKTWTVQVVARQLKIAQPSGVLTIARQMDSNIGGIWASIQDSYIRFFSSWTDLSSSTDGNTIWLKNFTTMIVRINPETLDYKAIGVDASISAQVILELIGTSEGSLECPDCTGINALAQDITDSTVLWVADDSGLYDYYSPDETWYTQSTSGVFYDLYEGANLVYAASSSGIYELPYNTKIYDSDTRAICVVENTDASGDAVSYTVWAVSNGSVIKINLDLNGLNPVIVPVPQPPEVINSIDVDARGWVWCGRYWLDKNETSWDVIPDAALDGVTITKSIASGEGLVYLLTDSGVLYRW